MNQTVRETVRERAASQLSKNFRNELVARMFKMLPEQAGARLREEAEEIADSADNDDVAVVIIGMVLAYGDKYAPDALPDELAEQVVTKIKSGELNLEMFLAEVYEAVRD